MKTLHEIRAARLQIAVLAGGESAERAVSLESGAAVAEALGARGHEVAILDPLHTPLTTIDWRDFDLAFLTLHGTFGEDGQVQTMLDHLGVPYTGSDAACSRVAFSKTASKGRFLQLRVPTPPYLLLHATDSAERIERHVRQFGYPLVVKPDAQGSSLGVSIVRSPDELPRALTECFQYGGFGLIEPYIEGTEWTVGVLDGQTLPVIEIASARPFYDYEAKYHDEQTQYLFENDLPSYVLKSIEQASQRACDALGTRGVARVDLRLDRLQRPWVLEVNTIPGFTSHSLIPKAAARTGMSFDDLCDWAVRSALQATAPPLRVAS